MIRLASLQLGELKEYDWIAHFVTNHEHRLQIDFSQETKLSESEKNLIFPSIQRFHKGEASDGHHLLDCVKRYAEKTKQPDYLEAMKWFVREENWHSAYLKKYMDFYEVPACKHSILDSIFRKLRKSSGLKCEIIVLVTAEMIALSYYDALSKCTESDALKKICSQMLYDELRHVVFQSYTLYKMNTSPIENLARIILMELTVSVVWLAMKDVFRAGGYSFRHLLKESLGYLHQSIAITKRGKL